MKKVAVAERWLLVEVRLQFPFFHTRQREKAKSSLDSLTGDGMLVVIFKGLKRGFGAS